MPHHLDPVGFTFSQQFLQISGQLMLPTIFPLASIAVNPFIFYHFSGFMGEREIIPECSICCSGREISRCCPLFQPEEAGPASASGSLRRAAFSPSRPAGLRAPARPCPAAAWRGARPLCTPPGGWRHVPAALTGSLGRVHLGRAQGRLASSDTRRLALLW